MIRIIAVGKLKNDFMKEACNEFMKRITGFTSIEMIEVKKEEDIEHLLKDDFIITLDADGKQFTSEEFSDFIKEKDMQHKRITFLIGGDEGFSEEFMKKADFLMSFSKMIFPHLIVRFFLLEQIYRAFTIIKGTPYHK